MDPSVRRRIVVKLIVKFTVKVVKFIIKFKIFPTPQAIFVLKPWHFDVLTSFKVAFINWKSIGQAIDLAAENTESNESLGTFWNESLLGIDGFSGPM